MLLYHKCKVRSIKNGLGYYQNGNLAYGISGVINDDSQNASFQIVVPDKQTDIGQWQLFGVTETGFSISNLGFNDRGYSDAVGCYMNANGESNTIVFKIGDLTLTFNTGGMSVQNATNGFSIEMDGSIHAW